MFASNEIPLRIKELGFQAYESVWHAMQRYSASRNADSPDQIWLVQHPPVFTQGRAGKPEHLLNPGDIPVIKTDRGGQVTYHGPGQQIAYLLVDIRRRNLGIRALVSAMENAIIGLLKEHYGISALARQDAPGVYVNKQKIAALGLRVTRGCSYHGLSFNLDMDLEPFSRINPCGYQGLEVTQLADLATDIDPEEVKNQLVQHLLVALGYNQEQIAIVANKTNAAMGSEKFYG